MKGSIDKLTNRGYGFISVEDEEEDVFFHASELVDADFENLEEGTEVEFRMQEGEKGPSAVNVELV
ncbi:MAG: cold-shock protein [Candidatus Magasanikbacteria bacterium]